MTRVQILLPEVTLLFRLESAQAEPLLGLIGQAGKAGGRRGARDHDRILVRAAREQGRR